MQEVAGIRWNLLCCWEGVLAYGPFLERLVASLSLRGGGDRQQLRVALGKIDPRLWARGEITPGEAVARLENELEPALDEASLLRSFFGALYFRASGLALLDSMKKDHRTVVIGDTPPGLTGMLRDRLSPLMGEPGLVFSSEIGASFRDAKTFTALLKRLGSSPRETILVGGDQETSEAARQAGLRTFGLPARMRTAWTCLQRFLEESAKPAPETPVEVSGRLDEGNRELDDAFDPGVADPLDS